MKIIIIGGGVIGLGLAGEWADSHDVTLLERGDFGKEASHAAAGMLGPVMEVEYNEPEQLELNLASHELYPEFVSSLEGETGIETGFRTDGTFMVASTPAEIEELNRLFEYQKRIGLDVERVSVEECRNQEPRISTYVSRVIHTTSDYQVDNRRLCKALLERCEQRGVDLHPHEPVTELKISGGRIQSVRTPERAFEADRVIICMGAWSRNFEGLPEPDRLPLRPVKGQALSVALSDPPEIEHVIRGVSTYCVPKDDGRMVIGSTMEEEGFDKRTTAGGVLDLLHKAYEILPFIYEQELLETWANLRPAMIDSLPALGPAPATENLGFATGHYRNGILLTPVTIKLMTEWLETGTVPELMKPVRADRFKEES